MKKAQSLLVVSGSLMILIAFQNCSSSGDYSQGALATSSAASVAATANSCFYNGALVPNGTIETGAFSVGQPATGVACPAQDNYTCNNGSWSGSSLSLVSSTVSEIFSVCSGSATCTVDGTVIPSGGTHLAYSATSVPAGSLCATVAATLSCNNGILTSSVGAYSTYTHIACAPRTLTWNYSAGDSANYISLIFGGGVSSQCPGSPSGKACTNSGAKCYASDSTSIFHCQ